MSPAKNMCISIGKNISKNLSSKYKQKLLDHATKTAIDALKTASKRAIQNTAKATDDLMGKNIADKIKKLSRILLKNSSETVTNEAKNIGIDR